MKKVINITMGGLVFAIEQDAYDTLAEYITNIKVYLHGSQDSGEIIEDIERAIAEKFVARGRSEKAAVTTDDVAFVIAELGTPEAIADGTDAAASETSPHNEAPVRRRLFRDPDDVTVAGVASGIAAYFAIDPIVVRLAFVLLAFANGFGILLYALLWLLVPVAKTTADKYAMHGEQVTLTHITSRIKSTVSSVREEDRERAKNLWGSVRSVLAKIFALFGIVVRILALIARYGIGVGLIFAGALGISAAVSALCIVLSGAYLWMDPAVQVVFDVVNASMVGYFAIGSFFVMISLPFLVIIMLGSMLIARRNPFTTQKVIALGVVWVIAAGMCATTIALQVDALNVAFEEFEERMLDTY